MFADAAPQTTSLRGADRRLELLDLPGDERRAPLVLLHEGLGSIGLWRGLPGRLAAATGRRVIAFSRFGHGRSEPPAVPRTEAFFHQEALEVLPAVLTVALGVAARSHEFNHPEEIALAMSRPNSPAIAIAVDSRS